MYTVSQKHAKCVKNSALKFSAVDKQMLENPRGIFFGSHCILAFRRSPVPAVYRDKHGRVIARTIKLHFTSAQLY